MNGPAKLDIKDKSFDSRSNYPAGGSTERSLSPRSKMDKAKNY